MVVSIDRANIALQRRNMTKMGILRRYRWPDRCTYKVFRVLLKY